MDGRVIDVDAGGRAHVEGVGVVATTRITIRIVNGDFVESEVLSTIDAKDLDGRVLDGDVLDRRVGQAVGVEKLRLGLAAITSFSIPPAGAISVEHGS